jgi:hypothetical protein
MGVSMNSSNEEDRQAVFNLSSKDVRVIFNGVNIVNGPFWVNTSYTDCSVRDYFFKTEDILRIDDRIGYRDIYLKGEF